MGLKLRNATAADIPFLVETILEAEKSGTDILSYTTIFGLNEDEARKYISLMLEEEIDGCELSISGFLLAEIDDSIVGAVCAWREGAQELPSATLKSNLLLYTLPEAALENLINLDPLIKELRIDCVDNSIQIGLVYISELARGKGLAKILINEKIVQLTGNNSEPEDVYIHVYGNNLAALKAYKEIGFESVMTKTASNVETEIFLPSSSKIQMKYNPKLKTQNGKN